MSLLIVGMNDPSGRGALLTKDPGSAGHRLWQISGLPLTKWARVKRTNLLATRTWRKADADLAARLLLTGPLIEEHRHVVFLGREVEMAIKRCWDLWPTRSTFYFVPHPSGLCRYYNDPGNREQVGSLLRRLAA